MAVVRNDDNEQAITDMVAGNVVLELCRDVYAETNDAERRYGVSPALLRKKLEDIRPPALRNRATELLIMSGLNLHFHRECKLHRDKVKGTAEGMYSAPEPKQARKFSLMRAELTTKVFLEEWQENGRSLGDHTGNELKALSDTAGAHGLSWGRKQAFFKWLSRQTKPEVKLRKGADITKSRFEKEWVKVCEGK